MTTLYRRIELARAACTTPPRAFRTRWPMNASRPTSASIRPRRACTWARCCTVMGLARLQRFGHTPIAIVGGGTGMIGDPSGKSQERVLLSAEQIEANLAGISAQLERFLDFNATANAARIVNNPDWLGDDRAADVPARCRQALHRERHAAQGIGEPAARERGRDFVHGVQLPAAPGATIFSSCSIGTAARCRWAAAISGAISPLASI